MFDILVYLFETYAQPGHFPNSTALARKLTAVGFEADDISAALEWLAVLESHSEKDAPQPLTDTHAIRLYSEREQARLSAECRGFLCFLEQAGAINSLLREIIIERALALNVASVSLARLKVIALIVLWRRHPAIESVNALLLDELLAAEDSTPSVH
ncbi:MAG: DUF494 domain-containing protein [Sterolibacterium sp.]|nr:DUF494 domain-containing protein [Sterolibacterium sp.]